MNKKVKSVHDGRIQVRSVASHDDSESSGDATGSTDYEVIQAADESAESLGSLKLLKSESGNTNSKAHGHSTH